MIQSTLALALTLLFITEGTAPTFKAKNLKNKTVTLGELLEDGPVLLDFWATWCKPCLKAFPKLSALHEKYSDRGLTVVGINEDGNRSQSKIKPFVRTQKIDFEILLDNNNGIMRKFRVQVLPTTILLAPNGKIVARYSGYNPAETKKLEQKIVALLDEYKKE